MRAFWLGKDLPSEYGDPAIRDHLSFNGQLHFRCPSCHEVTWGDITFSKTYLKSGKGIPCSNCRHQETEIVQFQAIESRICKSCGTQSFARQEDEYECSICRSRKHVVSETLIQPSYPSRLYVMFGQAAPFGQSPEDDRDFLIEYISALRMSPQFHRTCIHMVSFIDSIFQQLYGSSEEASELLNLASSLMRTIYKETGDRDAAYLSISIMIEARDLAHDPFRRAVYGLNINQNVYSVLARRDDEVLSILFDFDLKEYGIWLSRQTLAALEAIVDETLANLRAQQKWLLGDILKASNPSKEQIDEALHWFEAALQDPALPREMAGYVRESALAAQAKRRNLTLQERREIQKDLSQLTEEFLDKSEGIQKIQSLSDLLTGDFRVGQEQHRRALALRCLGEAIIYTASNDPKNILRHSGSILSRLVAGFATERFDSGVPLEGIAGVEAFRSLAIDHGNVSKLLGHHVHSLEVEQMTKKLLAGEKQDPIAVANTMLMQYKKNLEVNIRDLLDSKTVRFVLWFEIWNGKLITARIRFIDGELVVHANTIDLMQEDMEKAFKLPMAYDPPGRLRARRVEAALGYGWDTFKLLLEGESVDHSLIFLGPSSMASWPIDAAEVCQSANVNSVRSVTFSPSINVASAAYKSATARKIANILVLSYGGTDLIGTKQEIEDIKGIYGTGMQLLDGKTVSKKEVLSELRRNYDVIHFCGHGDFDYSDPMKSKIYFREDDNPDGVITAEDVLNCESIGNNPIVVLSACTSALVMPNGSNNFLGLAGALIRTGATSIVGARWPISDSVGAAFSKHFHTRLAAGYSVDDAVAYAKNQLRDARLDEWSAFMTVGS